MEKDKRIEYYRLLVKSFREDYTDEFEEHVEQCALALGEMKAKYGHDIPYEEFLISIGQPLYPCSDGGPACEAWRVRVRENALRDHVRPHR